MKNLSFVLTGGQLLGNVVVSASHQHGSVTLLNRIRWSPFLPLLKRSHVVLSGENLVRGDSLKIEVANSFWDHTLYRQTLPLVWSFNFFLSQIDTYLLYAVQTISLSGKDFHQQWFFFFFFSFFMHQRISCSGSGKGQSRHASIIPLAP